jgi:hypothetical protein
LASGLLQKNEHRSILLIEQMKKFSDENVQLIRKMGELGTRETIHSLVCSPTTLPAW